MNTKNFIEIISKPVHLKNEQIFELEEITQSFPYFQAAKVLYLKGLKNQNSYKYNEYLRVVAAHTSDRSVLFHYITSDDFFDSKLNKQKSKIISDIELIDERVIDNLNKEEPSSEKELIEEGNSATSIDNLQEEISPTIETKNILDTEETYNKQLDVELSILNITTASENQSISLIEEEDNKVDSFKNTEDEDAINIEENIEQTSDTDLIQEIESTFELDLENKIEPEINEEEIEIYIESYSGQLDKDEIRSLLDQYKRKSDSTILNIENEDGKEQLNFELSTDDNDDELVVKTQSESDQRTIEDDIDANLITLHSEVIDNKIEKTTNPFGFIFEIDQKEAIETISDAISESNEETTAEIASSFELRFEPIQENHNTETTQELIPETIELAEEQEESEPISFEKEDTHSFNEWLQLSSFNPIDRSESTTKEAQKEKNKDLIDTFIDNNPKITPIKAAATSLKIDLNQEESFDGQTVMTETLAQIYTDQKKYKNAIKAYEVLSLKFPEKSGFFADQIKMLKKLKHE
ncbi:MAG TPA: hypothetical protein EYG92_03415 [Lutibacter sp.]|nr:hypothetical protein [Lutibacter sp.]